MMARAEPCVGGAADLLVVEDQTGLVALIQELIPLSLHVVDNVLRQGVVTLG